MTMMLLGVNVLFYLILPSRHGIELPRALSDKVTSPEFIVVQSSLYESYLKIKRPQEWREWNDRFYQGKGRIQSGQLDEFWYKLSFHDGDFLKVALAQTAYGDSIKYQNWKQNFIKLRDYQKNDFAGVFGVSLNGLRWSHFFTYQFIHAGFLHLFSNMMILLFFGVLVELQMGSLWVAMIYIVGGALGGLFYTYWSGLNMAPLIGASGSVSALIAFLLIVEPRRHLRFFYFIFPSEDYFGDIYLSKWWLVPLLVLGDLNAVLTTPDWTQGVAHTAHLGAILFGLTMGLLLSLLKKPVPLHETLSWVRAPSKASPPPTSPI